MWVRLPPDAPTDRGRLGDTQCDAVHCPDARGPHDPHRLARDIAADLRGVAVRTESRQSRFAEGARRLDGQVLLRSSAYGKHLFLQFDAGDLLHIHLGLFGRFGHHLAPFPEPSEALRIRLASEADAWDLTGAMTCELRAADVVDEITSTLGPDPLRRGAKPGAFVRRVRSSRRAIGALLLDQSVIAGLGNVYRAEILHLTGVHPARTGASLSEEEVGRIWDTAVEQLRLGLRRNRIVTVPLNGRRLASMTGDNAIHVYKQEQCRTCGAPVEWSDVGGRTTYACTTCQPR